MVAGGIPYSSLHYSFILVWVDTVGHSSYSTTPCVGFVVAYLLIGISQLIQYPPYTLMVALYIQTS